MDPTLLIDTAATPPLCKLSVNDLIDYATTSQQCTTLAREEMETRHVRMLASFFDEPERLLHFLGETQSVISGSFVVNYLLGDDHWHPDDLDIYVPMNQYDAARQFVVDVCGYAEDATWEGFYPGGSSGHIPNGISGVAKFSKGNKSVDVVRSSSLSATYPIARFWSTLQMNYLSSTGLCCAYPQLTFRRMGVLNPIMFSGGADPVDCVQRLVDKYEARGYSIHLTPRALGLTRPSNKTYIKRELTGVRTFGDRLCLVGGYYLKTIRRGGSGWSYALPEGRAVSNWLVGWELGARGADEDRNKDAWVWDKRTGVRDVPA